MRQAQIEDWITDLVEFGPEIVSKACLRWRQQPGGKRPTSGDIRVFCIEMQREERDAEQIYLPAPGAKAEREERARRKGEDDRREGRAIANEWAQRRGYADLDAYAEGERVHISEAYRRVIAETLAGSPIGKLMTPMAQQLGVKVREYTQEEMRTGRIAIGLEAESHEPRAAE